MIRTQENKAKKKRELEGEKNGKTRIMKTD